MVLSLFVNMNVSVGSVLMCSAAILDTYNYAWECLARGCVVVLYLGCMVEFGVVGGGRRWG